MERNSLKSKLKYIYIMIIATIVILSIQSNIVYADTNVIVEADYADGFSYTSSGGGEWYSTYYKGKGYKGQGVLVYMLERDGGGAVAGVTPKAFPCSTDVKRIELNAQDKYKNYSAVTTWESGYIMWATSGSNTVSKNGAIMYDSLHSNVADIKTWLLTKTSTSGGEESTQGIDLVQNLWGADIAQRFADNEIVFIAEPIVAIQYSQSISTGFLNRLECSLLVNADQYGVNFDEYNRALKNVRTDINDFLCIVEANNSTTGLSNDLSDKLPEVKHSIDNAIMLYEGYEILLEKNKIDNECVSTTEIAEYARQLNEVLSETYSAAYWLREYLICDRIYQTLGEPIAGTPVSLVEHYNELEPDASVFNFTGNGTEGVVSITTLHTTLKVSESGGSWYRRSANSHTFIRASRGAILFNGSGMEFWNGDQNSAWQWHSDENIENIAIGMLAMMAWNDPDDRIPTESQYVIHESEIAKPIETENELSSLILGGGSLNMTSLSDACNGHKKCVHSHSDSCKDDDGGHGNCSHSCSESSGCITYCSSWTLTDNSLTFKLKNNYLDSYPKILWTTGSNFKPQLNSISKTRGTTSSTSVTVNGYKYKIVVYRGNDKLNYAEYKNNINKFNFTPTTIKTTKTRKEEDYTEELNFYFVNDGSDTTTTSKGSKGCTDTDTIDLSGKYIELNNIVSVETYSGRETDPHDAVGGFMTIGTTGSSAGDTIANGRMISTGKTIKFNPYIQMTYAGQDKEKHNVAVLSEYRREIYPNDYAEIVYTKQKDNLLIQSQMWALDANLTTSSLNGNGEEWRGINQVLKGGATIYLTDKQLQTVTVATYQTVLEGESLTMSEVSGSGRGSLTISDAEAYHQEFVDSVKNTFEATEIEQWVSTDTSGEKPWDTREGIQVTNNSSLSKLNNGSTTASSESKYYFHTDIDNTKNAQRNDLDVSIKGTSTAKYRFYSDVYGNIYMNGTKLLSKDQGIDKLTNSTAININNRTYAVTKLVDAIERNTGNDTTAEWATEDGHWYNEAYYGITVYVQKTTIGIGLTAGINPTRMSVLDPKLIPKVTSKRDQGTTAFSLAFRADLTNLQTIGTFKGAEIGIRDIEDMFESNVVYITNMTVDDNR